MQIEQKKWTPENTWETLRSDLRDCKDYQLVIVFGSRILLSSLGFYEEIRNNYPKADILMNSTSGEIIDTQINDNTISLTAIRFEKTKFLTSSFNSMDFLDGISVGRQLSTKLNHPDLTNILVFADSQHINGIELLNEIELNVPAGVVISSGMNGSSGNFKNTLIGLNEQPCEGKVTAVAFYGNHLTVSHQSMIGWEETGEELKITKSENQTIYEIENIPAYQLYKKYISQNTIDSAGQHLLHPISMLSSISEEAVIRKITSINENDGSMTFSGTVPNGATIRMMKENSNSLNDATKNAGRSMHHHLKQPDLAIVISHIGRKSIFNARIQEEVEVIREILGETTAITGFYSCEETSSTIDKETIVALNQSMTITTMRETK